MAKLQAIENENRVVERNTLSRVLRTGSRNIVKAAGGSDDIGDNVTF